MALAGHSTTVKALLSSTAMLAEACANIDGGAYRKYRVTNAARRLIDIEQAVTVYKNAVAQPVTAYTFNPLFGIITFGSALLIGDAVTIDAYYGSLTPLLEVRDVSMQLSRTMLEKTSFDSGGVKTRMAGLKDATGTLEQLSSLHDDIDPGAGTRYLDDAMQNAGENSFILEVAFGSGSGQTFRAIILIDSEEMKAAVDDLVTASLNWQSSRISPATAGLRVDALFAFDNWS